MHTKKFSHLKRGKAYGTFLILLTFFLVFMLIMLFIEDKADFLPALSLLLGIASFTWFTYRFYKPAFTDILFSEDGIVSKTHFEQEKLSLNDIKGIWYYKNTQGKSPEIKPYSENNSFKGCMIILGDINRFRDAGFAGLDGITLLYDSFKPGYTTLHYRKDLDEILAYYNRKIQNRPETE